MNYDKLLLAAQKTVLSSVREMSFNYCVDASISQICGTVVSVNAGLLHSCMAVIVLAVLVGML